MTSISNNLAANTVMLYVNKNTAKQSDLLAQLSSGSRIVNSATDPASTAASTKLLSDAGVLAQAATNAANIQSLLQTADGSLSQIADILTQMKTLASQSLSGSVDSTSQSNIDTEFQKLLTEITNITGSTAFNGTTLIDGTYSTSVLVGTGGTATSATDTISLNLASGASAVNTTVSTLGISGSAVDTTAHATSALTAVNTAIGKVATYRAIVGSYTAQFKYSESVAQTEEQNITAAQSTIADADTSQVETDYNNASTLTQAGIAALTKAQSIPQDLLRLLQA